MIFLYIFLFEENYKVSKQSRMKEQMKRGDWRVKMRNKNICLELKMDRVVYFAARGGTGWWMATDARTLSNICSSSLSRRLHCWYLHSHCWALLQGSGTNTQGKQPMKSTAMAKSRFSRNILIKATKSNSSHTGRFSLPCKVKIWKLCFPSTFCLLTSSCEMSRGL